MKRYPRSFIQLITFGYLFVAVPLLAATLYVFVTLDTLANHYRLAIESVSETSRLSSYLAEDLIHMERGLRRYEVLKDAAALADYVHARQDWQGNMVTFAQLPGMAPAMVEELNALVSLEQTAFQAFESQPGIETLRAVIDEIKVRSKTVRDNVRAELEQEQAQFEKESDALRNRLLLTGGLAVFVALIFFWLSWRLLARLIGHFERALVRLGKGDLQHSIVLDGPGDLRWLGRWLDWLRRRLLSLEEARTQVLRHVSHELKTPLAAMHEGSSLLAEEAVGPLTQEQRRIVGILQSNSRRLQDLIDGLLRLQQTAHAAERIGHEWLRFDELIEHVVETHRLIASERLISFKVQLERMDILAGREALLTIVHNLLSNAVKFSPDGATVIVQLGKSDNKAVLDVVDQGIGIPAHDLGQIFEPFYRSSSAKNVAGVGLGLSIAREFVLAHRGELKLMDSTGGGAHFRVTLPLDAPYLRKQNDG